MERRADKIKRYFFFQAEDGIRGTPVTGVQTCALPICFNNCPRFILIDNVENLNINSLNALLKIVEEPNKIGRASCRERV